MCRVGRNFAGAAGGRTVEDDRAGTGGGEAWIDCSSYSHRERGRCIVPVLPAAVPPAQGPVKFVA